MSTVLVLLAVVWCTGIAAQPENLIPNPSFEQAVDGTAADWVAEPAEGVRWRDDGGQEGRGYVRFTDQSDQGYVVLSSRRLPCRPGGLYTASAWFRTADTCQPGVYLNFHDEGGTRIHNLFSRATGPTEGWVQVTVTATAPMDAVEVCTSLYAYVGDVGDFDADSVITTVEGGREPGYGAFAPAQPGDKDMVDIGSRLELFVDGFMIDSLAGDARRVLHRPQRCEEVLRLDRPWEGPFCGYFALIDDGDKFRMYYRGWPRLEGKDYTCVAESEDGIHFTRPNVGIYEVEGSRDNNIVWAGPGCHNFTPFRDDNPACRPEERYKALASAGPGESLVAFVSPDGYRWSRLREEPVITEGAFDSQNLAFWDQTRARYVEFHRGFRDGVRDVMTSTSEDFLTWTKPVWCEYGDAPKEHLYTNATVPYFRAPHLFLGFPCRFVPGRKKLAEHAEDGVNDGVLMSSRDGLSFERWTEAFLRPAINPHAWTDRNNYIAWGLAPTSDEEISLYWTENYRYPDYQLRRGVIRTDGFVSVQAGAGGGEVLTRPFVFSGKSLTINYATSAAGSLRLELCGETGAAYDGFSAHQSDILFGNEIAHEVTWEGRSDVGALQGKPVRLRVRIKDGDLYSFGFGGG